jgi:hypothetical protein
MTDQELAILGLSLEMPCPWEARWLRDDHRYVRHSDKPIPGGVQTPVESGAAAGRAQHQP